MGVCIKGLGRYLMVILHRIGYPEHYTKYHLDYVIFGMFSWSLGSYKAREHDTIAEAPKKHPLLLRNTKFNTSLVAHHL